MMSERMPAKRRTTKTPASSGNSDDPEQGDDEYRQKRMRNNEAVKKSREKTNKTASERKERVEKLKRENIGLEAKILEKEQHIQILKDLLLSKEISAEDKERMTRKIQPESDDDD